MRALVLVLVLVSLTACVHHAVAAPSAAVAAMQAAQWTLPADADDDARFCVQVRMTPWTDPADVYPLRCASVGAVRHWLMAQRMAE